MTGIEELRAIRRKGYKPEIVFVRDSDSQLAKECAKDWHKSRTAFLVKHMRRSIWRRQTSLRRAIGGAL